MSSIFSDFVRFCNQQSQLGEKTVLATIIETTGSSYQKAGARMIVSSNKSYSGILAGGCFEGDLIEQAGEVFKTGKSKTLFYDMRSPDDVIWGLGLGCNGAVRIFLQSLDKNAGYTPISELADAAAAGEALMLCSVIDSEHDGLPAGTTVTWNPAIRFQHENRALVELINLFADRITQQRIIYDTASVEGSSVTFYCERILPAKHLLLLGAGPDAIPLVNMATQLRWDITVADHRPAYLVRSRFPEHVQLVKVRPESISSDLPLHRYDAMVLMTHSIDYDIRYVKELAHSTIPYIGLLGPAHRRDQIYNAIGDLAASVRNRSHGPVGLDIGSKTPDEIALSILAEIQAVCAGRTGGMLDDRPVQVHANVERGQCHAILLAAGDSSRMGQPKQLLEFRGKPLILHTCEQLQQVFQDRFKIILGANDKAIRQALNGYEQHIVYNPDWSEGLASSIRTGISSLPESATAAMVVLADQPLITSHALEKLVSAWRHEPGYRVASHYESSIGVPAIFPDIDFELLMRLHGDQGAKHFFKDKTKVKTVSIPEAAIDLDTDAEYRNFMAISA